LIYEKTIIFNRLNFFSYKLRQSIIIILSYVRYLIKWRIRRTRRTANGGQTARSSG